MWRVVPASVVGTSHERTGTPCQDAWEVLRCDAGGEQLVLIAVADGAGSASHSDIGSREAVKQLLAVIHQEQFNFKSVNREQARCWMHEVLDHLGTVAEREKTTVSELATTLLLGIVAKTGAVLAQIGDGGWVVEKDGEVLAGTWPQNGEFANITTFLTSESALDTMQFVRIDGNISAVAGFTDGLQMLALEFSVRRAHSPFFKPMFESVRACDDATSLIAPLQGFLASEAVISRTDDDKTLVLACWLDSDTEVASHDIVQ